MIGQKGVPATSAASSATSRNSVPGWSSAVTTSPSSAGAATPTIGGARTGGCGCGTSPRVHRAPRRPRRLAPRQRRRDPRLRCRALSRARSGPRRADPPLRESGRGRADGARPRRRAREVGRGRLTRVSPRAAMRARIPDPTIVVSEALQEHYRADTAATPSTCPTAWRCTDRPRRRSPRPPRPRRRQYVLLVGRLVPEKAVDLLIRAFRGCPATMRLVVAGSSSFLDGFVDQLQALARPDRRRACQARSSVRSSPRLYQARRGLLLPVSLEGLPLTLLEAASHGLPVAVSDIPLSGVCPRRAPGNVVPTGDERRRSAMHSPRSSADRPRGRGGRGDPRRPARPVELGRGHDDDDPGLRARCGGPGSTDDHGETSPAPATGSLRR